MAIGYDRGQGVLRNRLNGRISTPLSSWPGTVSILTYTRRLARRNLSKRRDDTVSGASLRSRKEVTIKSTLRLEINSQRWNRLTWAWMRGQFLIKKTFSQVQPKISLAWVPSEQVTFFANWGIGFKSEDLITQEAARPLKALSFVIIDANLNISDQFEKRLLAHLEWVLRHCLWMGV